MLFLWDCAGCGRSNSNLRDRCKHCRRLRLDTWASGGGRPLGFPMVLDDHDDGLDVGDVVQAGVDVVEMVAETLSGSGGDCGGDAGGFGGGDSSGGGSGGDY